MKKNKNSWEYQGKTKEQYQSSAAIVFYTIAFLCITMLTLTLYNYFVL